MKKTLTLFMALCLLMTLFAVPTMASSGTDFSDNFNSYTDTSGTVLPDGWTASSGTFFTNEVVTGKNSSGVEATIENGFSTIKSVDKTTFSGGTNKGNSVELSINHNRDTYIVRELENPATGMVEVKVSVALAPYPTGGYCAKAFYLYDDAGNRYEMFCINYINDWWSPVTFDNSLNYSETSGYRVAYERWYDFTIKLDLVSQKAVYTIYDCAADSTTTIEYATQNLNIKNVKKLQFGLGKNQYYQAQGTVATAYLDDISVKSINRTYAYNREYDFSTWSEYTGTNVNGNGYEVGTDDIFRFVHASYGTQGIVDAERGKALKLTQTLGTADGIKLYKDGFIKVSWNSTDLTTTSYKTHAGMPITTVVDLGIALKFEEFMIDRVFGFDSIYNEIFRVGYDSERNSEHGVVKFLSGSIPSSKLKIEKNKWYDFKVSYDFANSAALLEVYQNGKLLYSEAKSSTLTLTQYTTFVFGAVDRSSQNLEGTSSVYIDDVKVSQGEPVYLPNAEGYAAFDIAYSSPMSARKVAVDTPLSVTFNNTINQSSFTTDSVKVYENGVAVASSLSFDEDGYTVLLDAELDYGKYYDVVFTGVADSNGNTLTDYIEFSTYNAPFVITEPTVSSNGTKRTLAAKVESGDGFAHSVNYISALYEGDKLISVKFEGAKVYPGSPLEVAAELTMPAEKAEGKEYRVKGMLWKAGSLQPITEAFDQVID